MTAKLFLRRQKKKKKEKKKNTNPDRSPEIKIRSVFLNCFVVRASKPRSDDYNFGLFLSSPFYSSHLLLFSHFLGGAHLLPLRPQKEEEEENGGEGFSLEGDEEGSPFSDVQKKREGGGVIDSRALLHT